MSRKKRSNSERPYLTDLRTRAEDLTRTSPTDIAKMTTEEVQRLVHELQIHQVELKLQNEELRNAQLELAESLDRYSGLYEFAPIGYVTLNKDGKIINSNLAAATLLGIERQKLLRADLSRFVSFESQDDWYLHRQIAFSSETKQVAEIQMRKADGTPLTIRLESIALGSRDERLCRTALSDISERRHLEERLRRQDQDKLYLQSRMIESSFDPIFIWEFDGRVIEWNHGCERLYGFGRSEAIGRLVHDLLQTRSSLPLKELKSRIAAQGEWIGELLHTTKDGREVIVESRWQMTEISGRRLVLETTRDITERKHAHERLQESESRFRIVADSAPVPIWVNGFDGGCEFANKAYLDFFGKTLAEVHGFGWQPHAHPDDDERYVSSYLAAFHARAPFRCLARFRNADGEYRWLDSIGLPRFAASGDFLGYTGASPDITERKRIELHAQFINQLDLVAFSQIGDPDEIVRLVTGNLAEYLDVDRCHLTEIDPTGDFGVIRDKWEGLRGVPSAASTFRLRDFIKPELLEALANGQAAIVSDVTTDPRTRDSAFNYRAFHVTAYVSIPAMNEKRWEATLTLAHSRMRDWRPDEVQLMRDVAARLWLAVKHSRAVEALRESEKRARRTLAKQMVAGVAESDSTGKFMLVNQRYCDITGRTEAELMELRIVDVTHPDDWPENAELFRRLFETGESFFFEKRFRRKDGSEIWVNTHVSPIRSGRGTIEESVSVVIDVTDRKRAEQELAAAKDRLAADLEAMTRLQRIAATFVRQGDLPAVLAEILEGAIAIAGAERGYIQLFDPTSGRLTIAEQRGFKQPFLDFWNSVQGVVERTSFETGKRVIVDDVAASPIFAGTPAFDVLLQAGVQSVLCTPVLSRSGNLLAVFCTHCGTPHDSDERALRLLDLLARQTADILENAQAEAVLRSAFEQAEAATRAKDEFLAVVSHELRSPLTSILGYVRLLRAETASVAEIKRLVEIIERNSRMQLRLIEDLLDTARIISGKLKLEVQPTDLFRVITAALEVVQPAALAKGIELRSDLDPRVDQITGDPDRLQQVVWNLLSNSIKFTPKGGRVEITLKRQDPHIQIVVRDTGKGIERSFLPHVFERFRQPNMSSTRRFTGLGLGLSLVKDLVELHGGTVAVESAGPGQGAAFTVRLPLPAVYTASRTERVPLATIRRRIPSLAGLRALIVDDEEEVRTLLTLTLRSYGAEAWAVASGKAALELLVGQGPEKHFDVLICDIGMPDEDGYMMIRKVRALNADQGGAIPAIALTAYGRTADRIRALEAGFHTHIVKPVEPDELAMVIVSLVKRFDGPMTDIKIR